MRLADTKLKPIDHIGPGSDALKQNNIRLGLKRSRENFQLILNSAAEGILSVDINGNCTFCNASCLHLLGYKREEDLLGKNMHKMIHCKYRNGGKISLDDCRIFQTYKNGRKIHADDEVFWRADGSCFQAEYYSHPQFCDDIVIGAVITFFDITARKRAEKELKESERSKEVLLSNLPEMVYRCNYDKKWTMQFVSKGCYELTGYKAESLLLNRKISFNALISPEYRNIVWDKWIVALASKNVFKGEYPIITASGNLKWVSEQGRGIYDSSGNIEAVEGFIIDITERKKREDEIQYLNNHDVATGLYNRASYEAEKHLLDNENNLPLSILLGDINGLKLINDAFGHEKGDLLIIETAKILQSCCRKNDFLARIGGDEFCILLPRTDSGTVSEICSRIRKKCEIYNDDIANEAFCINISLGYSTKETVNENLDMVIKLAEDYMYRRKLLESKSSHSAIIFSIKATMLERSHETEEHEERIAALSKMIGIKLHLSQTDLDELVLLATLHDIGKVGIDDRVLNKPGKLTDAEWLEMKKHPEIGFRIAMATPELRSIADYILSHHERWDGKGYPQNLAGTEIPLLSRILAVVDAYDAMTHDRQYRKALSRSTAIAEIIKNAGTQFDPEIAGIFIDMLLNNQP